METTGSGFLASTFECERVHHATSLGRMFGVIVGGAHLVARSERAGVEECRRHAPKAIRSHHVACIAQSPQRLGERVVAHRVSDQAIADCVSLLERESQERAAGGTGAWPTRRVNVLEPTRTD